MSCAPGTRDSEFSTIGRSPRPSHTTSRHTAGSMHTTRGPRARPGASHHHTIRTLLPAPPGARRRPHTRPEGWTTILPHEGLTRQCRALLKGCRMARVSETGKATMTIGKMASMCYERVGFGRSCTSGNLLNACAEAAFSSFTRGFAGNMASKETRICKVPAADTMRADGLLCI
jgi:hypothetical protein